MNSFLFHVRKWRLNFNPVISPDATLLLCTLIFFFECDKSCRVQATLSSVLTYKCFSQNDYLYPLFFHRNCLVSPNCDSTRPYCITAHPAKFNYNPYMSAVYDKNLLAECNFDYSVAVSIMKWVNRQHIDAGRQHNA